MTPKNVMRHKTILPILTAMTFPLCCCTYGHPPKVTAINTFFQSHIGSTSRSEYDFGKTALADGNPALAIEAFRKDLHNRGQSVQTLNALGVAYSQLGRLDVAERYFQDAFAIDQAAPETAYNLAALKYAEGRFDEARRFADLASNLAQSVRPGQSEPVRQAILTAAARTSASATTAIKELDKPTAASSPSVEHVGIGTWELKLPTNADRTPTEPLGDSASLPEARLPAERPIDVTPPPVAIAEEPANVPNGALVAPEGTVGVLPAKAAVPTAQGLNPYATADQSAVGEFPASVPMHAGEAAPVLQQHAQQIVSVNHEYSNEAAEQPGTDGSTSRSGELARLNAELTLEQRSYTERYQIADGTSRPGELARLNAELVLEQRSYTERYRVADGTSRPIKLARLNSQLAPEELRYAQRYRNAGSGEQAAELARPNVALAQEERRYAQINRNIGSGDFSIEAVYRDERLDPCSSASQLRSPRAIGCIRNRTVRGAPYASGPRVERIGNRTIVMRRADKS